MLSKSMTHAVTDLFSTILAGILKDEAKTAYKGLVGPATTATVAASAAAFPPAAMVGAGVCLAAYLSLNIYKNSKDEKQKQENQKMLRGLLRSTISTEHDLKQFLKERTAIEFDSNVDHNRILNRLKLLHNVCASTYNAADQTDKDVKTLQADLAQAIEANGQFRDDLIVFVENNFEWLKDDIRHLRADLYADIELFLRGRPTLQRRTETLSDNRGGTNPFWFGYQWASFVGRDEETKRLNAFLEANDKLLWWCITGSGGAGKSRLALELCLSLSDDWYAGFLDKDKNFKGWEEWQPSRPTLIIIDYASSRAEELGIRLENLTDRKDSFEHPVRFLLLERSAKGGWLERFKGTGGQREAIWNHCRWHDGIETDDVIGIQIGRLAPRYVEELIIDVYAKRQKKSPGADIIAKMIKRAGDKALPLYVALAADAMVEDGKGLHWDKKSLLESTLNRWKDSTKHKATAGAWTDAKHVNFLALATMTGGIERGEKGQKCLNAVLGKSPQTKALLPDLKTLNVSTYELLCGRPCNEKFYGLEPDVLGECFILDQFAAKEDALSRRLCWPDELKTLWQAAWKYNPLGSSMFLGRMAMDFSSEPMLRELQDPAVTHDKFSRFAWAGACVNLINIYGNAGNITAAIDIYGQFKKLENAYGGGLAMLIIQGSAAVNLIKECGDAGKMPDSRATYNDMKTQTAAYKSNPVIQGLLASAGVNLIKAYGAVGNIVEAQSIYEEIKTDTAGKDNKALRELKAKASANLTNVYSNAGNANEASKIYEDLKRLATEYKNEPAIRAILASAGVNLVKADGNAGNVAEARNIYEDTKAFAAKYKNNMLIQMLQAETGVNLASAYGGAGMITDARLIYDELKELADINEGKLSIQKYRAQAGVNLAISCSKMANSSELIKIYDELKTLATKLNNEPLIREMQAKAGFELIINYGRVGKLIEARGIYAEIKALAAEHQSESSLRLEQGKASVNLVKAYSEAGILSETQIIHNDIENLIAEHVDEPDLQQFQIGVDINIAMCHWNSKDFEKASEMLDETEEFTKQIILDEDYKKEIIAHIESIRQKPGMHS